VHLLTPRELERLRRRRADPAFADAWRQLETAADEALALNLATPREPGGWYHHYFCPEHGELLEWDAQRPAAHWCRCCNRALSGETFDAAWRNGAHHRLATGARACALAWQATGRADYAAFAARVLTDYADRYAAWEPMGEIVGQGRCLNTSLDEAVWSGHLAWAYDAVRAALTPAQATSIEQGLLQPAARQLLGQLWRRVHNIECWHLAGLALLGAALGDPALLEPALDASGLPLQLDQGVLDDGWWVEGSPSYHFYALQAVLDSVVALRRQHPAILKHPRLRALFAAPLQIMRADLSLPALNDGWPTIAASGGIVGYAACYERAWALWGDPRHAALLRRVYGLEPEAETTAVQPRASVDALLFGPDADELARAAPLATPGSRTQEPSGYAVLRAGSDADERWLLLKYGLHSGGHAHLDKLLLDLHAFGRRLAPDPGSPGYSVPLHGVWFRHTLSHNTLLVNGEAQPEAGGRLLDFQALERGRHGVADAGVYWPPTGPANTFEGVWIKEPRRPFSPAYAGVAARRCLLWRPGEQPYFIDILLVSAPEARQIDLAWHHVGQLVAPALDALPAVAWEPTDPAYQQIREPRRLPAGSWRATWRADAVGTHCWALDPPAALALAATTPANPPSETMASVLRRVTAARACFAAVFEPFQGQGAIRTVQWGQNTLAEQGALRLTVERADGRDLWEIRHADAPARQPIGAPPATLFSHQLAAWSPDAHPRAADH
jgi:hypothetical protein